MGEKYRVAFANFQLIVQQELGLWAIRISDLNGHEKFRAASIATAVAAKTAAVDWALSRLFGAGHRKDPASFAETLAWEPAGQE